MKGTITGLVAVHLGITLWHGNAHQRLGVTLSPEQKLFVYGVIVIAPIVATLLLWLHRETTGAWLFFLSMLGALLFGVYHHYVLVSADNVHYLPAGSAGVRAAFVTSAGALALLELAAVIYGALCLRRFPPMRPSRTPKTNRP
jgi:hypothetical membrane protein